MRLEDWFEAVNVQTAASDPDTLFNHYRKLTRLREQFPALQYGSFYPIMCDHPGVYAYLRTAEVPSADGKTRTQQAVLVICNFTDLQVGRYALSMPSSPLRGALTMLAFGLGTLPVMVSLTWAGERIGLRLQRGNIRIGAGVLVIIAGLLTLAAPWLIHAPVLHGLLEALGCRSLPIS